MPNACIQTTMWEFCSFRGVLEIKFSVILVHVSVKLVDRPMHNSCAVRYKMQELYWQIKRQHLQVCVLMCKIHQMSALQERCPHCLFLKLPEERNTSFTVYHTKYHSLQHVAETVNIPVWSFVTLLTWSVSWSHLAGLIQLKQTLLWALVMLY